MFRPLLHRREREPLYTTCSNDQHRTRAAFPVDVTLQLTVLCGAQYGSDTAFASKMPRSLWLPTPHHKPLSAITRELHVQCNRCGGASTLPFVNLCGLESCA